MSESQNLNSEFLVSLTNETANIQTINYPVGWGCRIHRLYLYRGVRLPRLVSWIWHETKRVSLVNELRDWRSVPNLVDMFSSVGLLTVDMANYQATRPNQNMHFADSNRMKEVEVRQGFSLVPVSLFSQACTDFASCQRLHVTALFWIYFIYSFFSFPLHTL